MNQLTTLLAAAPGSRLTLRPDHFVLTDGAAKTVPSLLEGRPLADSARVKVFIDHETPCGSEKHAAWQKQLIRFAAERGCVLCNGYGTSYQLMLEEYVQPGQVVAHCGDFGSTYGAAGAYAVKLTPEELARAACTGEVTVTAPRQIHLALTGVLRAPACAKDAALTVLPLLGDTGGTLVRVSGLADWPAAEQISFLHLLSLGGCDAALPEEPCGAPDVILALDAVVPTISAAGDPGSARPAAEAGDTAVTAVFIGGCSAGRIEDIRAAAAVLQGRRVSRGVRATLAFASTAVYLQAADEGLIGPLMDAGVLVMNQGCSACWGRSQGMADGKDVVLSAGSRPCPNCAGEGDVPTYLCSAATAAESAVAGCITPAVKEGGPRHE